jgi:hypothetical protein
LNNKKSRKEGKKMEYKTLCIPRIDNKIKKEYICEKINNWGVCDLLKITVLPIKNQEGYNRVILNVKWKRDSLDVSRVLEEKKTIKLVYDDPWYWKISEFKKVGK